MRLGLVQPDQHLLDALDPVILLLLGGGRHPVHRVLPLNHLPLTVSLASLDNLKNGVYQ